ncbi:MAG: FIST C-terminal domain-containing protein [Treponema sp.]|nr:FIST C-terminal domain-containing protein [Treponema sp.]
MIKMLTAHTFEVDDTDAAVKDIQEQLQSQGDLLAHTVGLLFCYLDFVTSGTAEAVSKALSFETLGCTTQGTATPAVAGDIVLSLAVLTSDDVEFHAGLSDPLGEDGNRRIVKAYQELAAPLQGSPALVFIVVPLLYTLAGDTLVGLLGRESRGAPVFGTGALDVDTKVRTPKVLYKGEAYADRMPILLFAGNLAPRFFIDSVWKHNIYSQKALVTGAEGNRIFSVNNMPAADYMKKIGLITEERLDLLFVFPLAMEVEDNAQPKLFIIYSINDDGSVTCSVNTPTGSVIYIGSPGSEEVIDNARNITAAVKKSGGEAALIFSCFSRSVILSNPRDEMEAIQEDMRDSNLPYLFIYSGGEVCPVVGEKGGMTNQYHNYTIVSCGLGTPPPPPPMGGGAGTEIV